MPRPATYTTLYPEVVRVTPENCEQLILGNGPTTRTDHRVSSRLHHSFEAIPSNRGSSMTPDATLGLAKATAPSLTAAAAWNRPSTAADRNGNVGPHINHSGAATLLRPQSCQPTLKSNGLTPTEDVNPRRWRRSVATKRLDLDLFASCGPLRVASALPTAWNRLHAVHEVLLRVPTANAAAKRKTTPAEQAAAPSHPVASFNKIVSHGPATVVTDEEILWAVSATTGASLAAKTAAVEAREQRLSTRFTAKPNEDEHTSMEDGVTPEQAIIMGRSPPPLPVGPPRNKALRLAWEVTQARQKQMNDARAAARRSLGSTAVAQVEEKPVVPPSVVNAAASRQQEAPPPARSVVSCLSVKPNRNASEVRQDEVTCRPLDTQVQSVVHRLEELEEILKMRSAATAPIVRIR